MVTQKEIIKEIAEHLGVTEADIDQGSSLKDDLGLGPIEIADLLNYLSNKYQIAFETEDTGGINTVNDLVVLVEDLMLE